MPTCNYIKLTPYFLTLITVCEANPAEPCSHRYSLRLSRNGFYTSHNVTDNIVLFLDVLVNVNSDEDYDRQSVQDHHRKKLHIEIGGK